MLPRFDQTAAAESRVIPSISVGTYSILRDHQCSRFNAENLLYMQLLDILLQVLKDLQDKKFIQWPKVYLHPTCEPEAADLKAKILSLRGEVAASAGEFLIFRS